MTILLPERAAGAGLPAAELAARIASRDAVIGVIGLGHVGLPLALASAAAGFRTIGIDINPAQVARLNEGCSPFAHIPADSVTDAVVGGRLAATTEPAALAAADAVLICVPTPLDAKGRPDLSHVLDAATAAVAAMRPGRLLVLESTTWPGTTRQCLAPVLEARGWRIGRDAFLAYSPEREDPGNERYRTSDIPKLVAGAEAASLRLALELYAAVVARPVPVASLEVAEAAKLVENVFRAVNIALANEFKTCFQAMGIDVWQVIEAAATKPFGFMPFWPGPGPGGHCIPVDPVYLAWAARRHGAAMPLLDAAIAVNAAAPMRVVARLEAALGGLADKRVLLLGLGYKRNLADVRESPALKLIEAMEAKGAVVGTHDPLVAEIPWTPEHPDLAGRPGLGWRTALGMPWDAAVIATDHDAVDYATLAARIPLVVDTRNSFVRRGLAAGQVIQA